MSAEDLVKQFEEYLLPLGYECAPFLVSWYNDVVSNEFKLNYDPDSLAILIISKPSMWETFTKFCVDNKDKIDLTKDPLDQCTNYVMKRLQETLKEDSEIITDHDMQKNRRTPRLLVQTAGHVAGCAYYYQRLPDDPEDVKWGVAIHPVFGGYFAFRAAFIFKNVQVPDLVQRVPKDTIGSNRIKLLQLWSKWDMDFRDVAFENREWTPDQKYNKEQDEFFRTLPEKRILPK
jgi:methylmalonic aciduria homocystinuria type C protein